MSLKSCRLLLLLPLLGMGKCEKDPAPAFILPAATQVGANTLGFIVDGRVWRNYGTRCTWGSCDSNKVRSYYNSRYQHFAIDVQQTAQNVNETFGILLDSLKRAGAYPTTQKVVAGRMNRQIIFNDLLTNSTSLTTEIYVTRKTGSVIITRFDTVNHIIAGVFDGILYKNRDSTILVHITEGRFDVKYQ